MSVTALSMKKMALAIFCVTLLMLVAAPARADVCSDAFSNHPCGVTITITGTSGQLKAVFGGTGVPYDGIEDQLVGITNGTTNVTVGAIVLSGPSGGEGLFGFDGDGPCVGLGGTICPGPTGYEGPFNTFVGIGLDNSTGKVLFTTPLAPGATTWFALERTPTAVVAIGENQRLAANSTATYKFGPFSSTDGITFSEGNGPDDFKITPQSVGTGGDSLTVTPVPVASWGTNTATNFLALQCVPYLDFDTNQSPVCVQIELDCTGLDQCGYLYTAQLDYGIDNLGLPSQDVNTGIGGPALLVQHDVHCGYPTTGYTDNIFQQYTGSTPGSDPPLLGGGKGGHSCYIAAFNPDPAVPPITQGQVVKAFFGFEFPVFDNLINPVFPPLPELLNWDSHDSSNHGIPNLQLCKLISADGVNCASPGVGPLWVHPSLTPVNCPGFKPQDPLPGTFLNLSKLLGAGEYTFVWDTSKVKEPSSCQVRVQLQFNGGAFQAPAVFKYPR